MCLAFGLMQNIEEKMKELINRSYRFDKAITENEVRFRFSLKIKNCVKTEEDKQFPFEDEIFTFNVGEEGKFGEESIYQNKLSVFRGNNGIMFGGYAPDFARKSDIIENGDEKEFSDSQIYNFEITVAQFRVYIDVNRKIRHSYGNVRTGVTGYAFYLRNGCSAELSDFSYTAVNAYYPLSGTVKEFTDKGIFTDCISWHSAKEGLYLDRMNPVQCLPCTTRNFVCYDSNIKADMYTDACSIELTYEAADSYRDWETQFGLIVDGKRMSRPIQRTRQNEVYKTVFSLSDKPKEKRVTIVFPPSVTVAVKEIKVNGGTHIDKVEKNVKILFLGDSITEGSGCIDPCAVYPCRVTQAFGAFGLVQAVGGMSFGNFNVDGEYPFKFDYVLIANGTNSFCGGNSDKNAAFSLVESDIEKLVSKIGVYFPEAKIIALLPIWRSDENGKNFTLKEFSAKMKEVYERLGVANIDCYDFVKKDFSYFTDPAFAIHPVSIGHDMYADNLIKELKKYIKTDNNGGAAIK